MKSILIKQAPTKLARFVMPLLIVSAAVSTACQQNPYANVTGALTKKPVVKVNLPNLSTEIPSVMSFSEGVESTYVFKGRVPSGQKPVFALRGLPDSATFLQDENRIVWNPPFGAGKDPADPTSVSRSYPIEVSMVDPADQRTSVTRSAMLIVKNVPRPMTVVTDQNSWNLTEGSEFTENLQVKSLDFPNGPFRAQVEDLPEGSFISIKADSRDPSLFHIKYTPPYEVVKLTTGVGTHFTLNPSFVLTGPNGVSVRKSEAWVIADKRVLPSFQGPTELTAGIDASMSFMVEDRNVEVFPKISVEPQPAFGTVHLRTTNNRVGNDRFVTTVAIFWDGIPADKFGTTQTLNLRACALATGPNDYTLCNDNLVSVRFTGKLHPAPRLDRSAWPLDREVYVRYGEPVSIAIPIQDAELDANEVKVAIEPSELSDQVSWSDGAIKISGLKAGRLHFSVVAKSIYGITTTESFLAEVLPSGWSKTLILGDSLKDPEVTGLKKVLAEAQVANPSIQELSARTLAFRQNLFIGTSALQNTDSLPSIEQAIGSVENVVINSPLAASLFGGDLGRELKGYGIQILGRYLTLPGNNPALDGLHIEPGRDSGLSMPNKFVRLARNTTQESRSPLILNLNSNRYCIELLNLKKGMQASPMYTAAISCRRSRSGKILIAGFEWSDLAPDAVDYEIVKKWMKEW